MKNIEIYGNDDYRIANTLDTGVFECEVMDQSK